MFARLILSAISVTCVVSFAACGGGDDDSDTPTAEATAKPSAGPTEIKALTPQQIVEEMAQSVVHIKATYPQGTGGGSGIVWGDATHILTNAHVVTAPVPSRWWTRKMAS